MKSINLALQGGGSHGAFTWGVLDALLQDGRLDIHAISCASAGAMNACALVSGWMKNSSNPREGARLALKEYWHAVSRLPSLSSFPLWSFPWGQSQKKFSLHQNPWFFWTDLLSRIYSPYQLNPFNFNALASVVREVIDIDALNACHSIQLYVCATNVKTGRVAVFSNHESAHTVTHRLSVEALLASACLPFSFQAVQVDDQYYWDGGYMGNPSMFPLYDNPVPDILLVQINPLIRDDVPDTADEIIDRVNEISFNSSLMLEMRAVEFVQKLLLQEKIDPQKYKRILMHAVEGGDVLANFGASSKANTSWEFLSLLHDAGLKAGENWLLENYEKIGCEASINVQQMFL